MEWIFIVIIAVVIVAVYILYGAKKIFRLSCMRGDAPDRKTPDSNSDYFPIYLKLCEGKEYSDKIFKEESEIISFDGLVLKAHIYEHSSAKRVIICFHGFRSAWDRDFAYQSKFFIDNECSVILVTQRAHGESGGKYLGYGVLERYDCLKWAEYAANRFTGLPIYLAGISMGSSTVLMASELGLPENVSGIIADCGFTSPWEEFNYILKRKYTPGISAMIFIAGLICKRRAGYGFRDVYIPDIMKSCNIPILFVHGEKDVVVPEKMTYENYAACASPDKEYLKIKFAGHAFSYMVSTSEYQEAILRLFEKKEKI